LELVIAAIAAIPTARGCWLRSGNRRSVRALTSAAWRADEIGEVHIGIPRRAVLIPTGVDIATTLSGRVWSRRTNSAVAGGRCRQGCRADDMAITGNGNSCHGHGIHRSDNLDLLSNHRETPT